MRRALLAIGLLAACSDPPPRQPITVHAAASLARPLRALADSFRAETEIPLRIQLGGSMELSRRTTDLGTPPDVLLLADDEVMAALMPAHIDWYVRFGTSRLVVAHAGHARDADSITTENWWRKLSAAGVTIGRADSAIAPAGRHALRLLRRAESYYGEPGLTRRLLERAAPSLVRPNAADLAALLDAGQVDYIIEYESVARQFGFRYVTLPADLAPSLLYGVALPRASTRHEDGLRFVEYLLGEPGKRLLRDADVDVLRLPVAIGRNIPPEISARVRTLVEAR